MEPGVVFWCYILSTSRFVMCVRGCSSTYPRCDTRSFQLVSLSCQHEPVWPFSSHLSSLSRRVHLHNWVLLDVWFSTPFSVNSRDSVWRSQISSVWDAQTASSSTNDHSKVRVTWITFRPHSDVSYTNNAHKGERNLWWRFGPTWPIDKSMGQAEPKDRKIFSMCGLFVYCTSHGIVPLLPEVCS